MAHSKIQKHETARHSVSPSGESFKIPAERDYAKELKRVEALVNQARKEKKEIVVVIGVGFVGAVMAAIVQSKDRVPIFLCALCS